MVAASASVQLKLVYQLQLSLEMFDLAMIHMPELQGAAFEKCPKTFQLIQKKILANVLVSSL